MKDEDSLSFSRTFWLCLFIYFKIQVPFDFVKRKSDESSNIKFLLNITLSWVTMPTLYIAFGTKLTEK